MVSRQRRGSAWRAATPYLLAGPGLALVLAMVFVPLISVIIASFTSPETGSGPTLENYQAFFAESFYRHVLANTLMTSVLTTVVCLVLGYPIALYVVFAGDAIRRYIILILLAPLLMSVVIRGFALSLLLGPVSPLNVSLPEQLRFNLLFTGTGVLIGLVYTLLPFLVLSVASSLTGVDRRVIDAARSLGAGFWTTIWRVVIPLSAQGVLSGSILVFTLSSTSVALPLILGGTKYKMLVSIIYEDLLLIYNWPAGFAVSLILVAVTMTILFVTSRAVGRAAEAPLQ